MKQIPLTQNKFALVNDEDYEWLNQFKWCYHKGYAVRSIYLGGGREKFKTKYIFMHRLINNTSDNLETDHKDRNKLNNQRNNLRTVTTSSNQINTDLRKDNTSGIKGVSWNKLYKKWGVQINVMGKRICLGYYSNIQGAWLARKWGEKLYHGII